MRDVSLGRLRVQHWNARGFHPRRWSCGRPWPTVSGGWILHIWLGFQCWDIVWGGRR